MLHLRESKRREKGSIDAYLNGPSMKRSFLPMLAVICLSFGSRAADGSKQAERSKEADSHEETCVMKEEE
jgi:hypothetical protein